MKSGLQKRFNAQKRGSAPIRTVPLLRPNRSEHMVGLDRCLSKFDSVDEVEEIAFD